MNGDDFVLAADGWSQITLCGEFPHVGAGVTQVIDRAACDAMAAEFNAADHRVGIAGHGALGARASGSGKLRRSRPERRRGLRRRGRPYCGNRPERRKGSSTFNPRL